MRRAICIGLVLLVCVGLAGQIALASDEDAAEVAKTWLASMMVGDTERMWSVCTEDYQGNSWFTMAACANSIRDSMKSTFPDKSSYDLCLTMLETIYEFRVAQINDNTAYVRANISGETDNSQVVFLVRQGNEWRIALVVVSSIIIDDRMVF